MNVPYKRKKHTCQGFTLIEMLIAMALTSILGLVLFSTYRMIISYGKEASIEVFNQEEKRQAGIIIDNDLANLIHITDYELSIQKDSFLSFAPQKKKDSHSSHEESSLDFTEDLDEEGKLEVVLAFTSHNSLYPNDSMPKMQSETNEHSLHYLQAPVYVEYIKQKSQNSLGSEELYNIFRKERSFAHLESYDNTRQMLLLQSVKDFEVELLCQGEVLETWSVELLEKLNSKRSEKEILRQNADPSIDAVQINFVKNNTEQKLTIPILIK